MQVSLSKNWCCYLLKCSDDTIYTGATNNINKRLAAHNSGKGSKYTRGRLPVSLICIFNCNSKSDALKLECKIKKLSKQEKLELCEKKPSVRGNSFNDKHKR